MGDNKQIATMESMFKLSIELLDKGELEHSIRVLSKILDNYSQEKRIDEVYSVLGGIYNDLEQYEKAMSNFKKATELNPDSELASLGLYVSLASLDKDVDAIEEMKKFLKSHPA